MVVAVSKLIGESLESSSKHHPGVQNGAFLHEFQDIKGNRWMFMYNIIITIKLCGKPDMYR